VVPADTRIAAHAERDARALAAHLDRMSRVLLGRIHGPGAAPEAAAAPPRGAFDMLVRAHRLNGFEADALLLAVGVALDADFARLLAAAGGTRRVDLTVSGALTVLLAEPGDRLCARARLRGDGPLVAYGLLRRRPIGENEHELVATRRAVAAALGQHPLADLPRWARRSLAAAEPPCWTDIDPRQAAAALRAAEPPGALCVVRGASGSGRTTWARSAVHALHPHALAIDVPRALGEAEAPAEAIAELCEDAGLCGVPVLLDDADDALGRGAPLVAALLDVLERVPLAALAVVHGDAALDPRVARRVVHQTRIGPPPPHIREALWGGDGGTESRFIADELVLSPAQIKNARRLVAAGVAPPAAALAQIEGDGLLALGRDEVGLSDLVVGDEVRTEIAELITAIRVRASVQSRRVGRGRGLSALFDGEPGTGKTMACDVVAAEVKLPLLRVNVAALVDKYIGETEKNLARTFAQARARGGILLFDEADALFARRTEVGRAQDRYANLETNLLLQLLEEHPGIVLLTTNLKGNLDEGFFRRLTFKIAFDPPDAARREILWRRHLPPEPGLDDAALARIAETFELTGGGIRNAVVRARYRAAGEARGLQIADLVACAERELAAMGRVAAW
jgi:hypothetical protein